jgi:hypothetical protein
MDGWMHWMHWIKWNESEVVKYDFMITCSCYYCRSWSASSQMVRGTVDAGNAGRPPGYSAAEPLPHVFLVPGPELQGRGAQKEWNGNDQKKERRVKKEKKKKKQRKDTKREKTLAAS